MKKLTRALTYLGVFTLATCTGGWTATAQERPPDGGIRVHGHWTIDVRNADGTLASHNEFENGLVPNSGDSLLSRLLFRNFTPFGWEMELADFPPSPQFGRVCKDPQGSPSVCWVIEAGTPTTDANGDHKDEWFPTLALNLVSPSFGVNTLEITGNVTASFAGSIPAVTSLVPPPLDPPSLGHSPFSGKALATPIDVVAGQKIYIKIVYSFS